MSEKIKQSSHEKSGHNPEHKQHTEKLKETIESNARKAKHEHNENIDHIRSQIEKEAHHKREKIDKKLDADQSESERPILVNKEIKNIAYDRTLRKTQAKLSPGSRMFSKLIHNSVIETTSEVAGKTIARPSGILFGGIFSFIGSSLFLWAARHYRYEYNFLLFVIFFAGGFFVGLIIELLVFGIRKSKK